MFGNDEFLPDKFPWSVDPPRAKIVNAFILPGKGSQDMPKLSGPIGEWDLPQLHLWRERQAQLRVKRRPLISGKSCIATLGSCFASEIAKSMSRLKLNGAMHPAGLMYTTATIRQEIERIFGLWPGYQSEPNWQVNDGFVHPFKDYHKVFRNEAALRSWSDQLDRNAEKLFRAANVVVITLGLIEAWRQPKTGNFYRQIPHPDVFPTCGAEFHRLTVAEMVDDLRRIRAALRRHTRVELIVTVSPIPLYSTMTGLDVRVANCESKSRVRAAVSEFVDEFPDVHYFQSYEIVSTAESLSDFMKEDGRHVHAHAVDYIVAEFLRTFACDDVAIPHVDSSWLTTPLKTSDSPPRPSLRAKLAIKLMRYLQRAA